MEFARRFGENLRRIREGAGLLQEALRLRCSLHRTEIGLLERGTRASHRHLGQGRKRIGRSSRRPLLMGSVGPQLRRRRGISGWSRLLN